MCQGSRKRTCQACRVLDSFADMTSFPTKIINLIIFLRFKQFKWRKRSSYKNYPSLFDAFNDRLVVKECTVENKDDSTSHLWNVSVIVI